MINFTSTVRRAFKALSSIGTLAIVPMLLLGIAGQGNIARADSDPGLAIAKLSVTTVDTANGRLLPNATVLVLDAQGVRAAKGLTNSAGVFEVKLPVGIYKVVVSADHYKQFGQTFTLRSGQVTSLKAGLQPLSITPLSPSL